MDEKRSEAMFASVVMMFHAAAIQHLGKVKNPATDKIERDLDQAQMAIDVLDMLSERTRGNLTAQEGAFLSRTLQELKLNYVDEIAKGPSAVSP